FPPGTTTTAVTPVGYTSTPPGLYRGCRLIAAPTPVQPRWTFSPGLSCALPQQVGDVLGAHPAVRVLRLPEHDGRHLREPLVALEPVADQLVVAADRGEHDGRARAGVAAQEVVDPVADVAGQRRRLDDPQLERFRVPERRRARHPDEVVAVRL